MKSKAGLLFSLVLVGGIIFAGLSVLRPVEMPSEDVQHVDSQLQADGVGSDGSVPGMRLYRISQGESAVEFEIDEVLRGNDTTVIGTTDQIAGDILLNTEHPSDSILGKIRVNARTLKTDDDNRNRALNNFILKTDVDANEFIEFTPRSITGWPELLGPGLSFDVRIEGDLYVSGVTKTATFAGSVALTEDGTITGDIETSVPYGNFDLSIPNLPFLANVEEDVILRAHVVALPVE